MRDARQSEHEEVRIVRGTRTGATITVAVYSTERGPAIGGCRIMSYPSWREGVRDALRLSEAMAMKSALAGLPYGGGKTVAVLPGGGLDTTRRLDLITDIAEVVAGFEGRYIAGPDIGSTPDDMALIHRLAQGNAFCRPEAEGGSGNSSAATARGVVAALIAGFHHRYGVSSIAGSKIGVIGLGHVGHLAAESLAREGARVIVTDIDSSLRADAERNGLEWATTDLLRDELDVLVPAATGGMLTRETASTCRAGLIVGPANNQLADDSVDALLHQRSVTWVPDMLAGAGGIIHAVSREKLGLDAERTNAVVGQIGDKVGQLLAYAQERHVTPLQAAREISSDTDSKVNA
ncbi:Glu/Leu/Phe/Val dehydrogenase dimerization domain-containing protein [Amycolatopsis ultiminotia]|uniref:Glu/Leu/Phe/Val dehydrogenase dimerization domain-containing protein n=1 Tax=Amycolatopsis ultiminotia TaxID=543629 RepID=A0ABP6WI26_9PSEU